MWIFIANFARSHWKLLAEITIAAVAVLAIWHGIANHFKAKYEPLIASANAERAQAQADLAAERVNFQKAQQASKDYQSELQKLRATASAAPVRGVRCSITNPRVPQASAPGGPDAASTGTGDSTQTVGSDIGPRLYGLADSCDAITAQLRGLQAWAKSVSE